MISQEVSQKAYTKLLKFLPEVTVTCINGELDGKILHLYDECEGLSGFFDAPFFSEDDPIVIDVRDHGIRTGAMEDVLNYLETGDFKSSFTSPNGAGQTTLHCGSVIVAVEFFDKFVLDKPLKPLVCLAKRYLKQAHYMEVVKFLFLMVEWAVIEDQWYALCMEQFCKNIETYKRELIRIGIERASSASIDVILQEVHQKRPFPYYDYVVVQSTSTDAFFSTEDFDHLLAEEKIGWIQSEDPITKTMRRKGVYLEETTPGIKGLMSDLTNLGYPITQCVVLEKVDLDGLMDTATRIKEWGYDTIECFDTPQNIYTSLGYRAVYILAL